MKKKIPNFNIAFATLGYWWKILGIPTIGIFLIYRRIRNLITLIFLPN